MTDVKERDEAAEYANASTSGSTDDGDETTADADADSISLTHTDREPLEKKREHIVEAPPPDPSQQDQSNGVNDGGGRGGSDENLADDINLPDEPADAGDFPSLPLSKLPIDKIDFVREPHNRVKLYVLCNQRVWDDRGTGHVACLPASDDSGSMCIVVRLEATGYENKVLESRIQLDTIYQKQQGTLIVWSETDTCDLALSFQEKAGCAEIWDKICRIQGRDPDVEEDNECDDQEPSDASPSGIAASVCATNIVLPPCDLDHLPDLKAALSDGIFLNTQREKLATSVQQNGYIPKLCDLFQICEDLEDTERLHHLYGVAKSLFLLNSNSLLGDLLDEKYFRDFVGMLEYDPSSPEPKKHRDFLWQRSKFREILPIKSVELKEKIHQTFRVQYVLDLCLPAPSLFEENLLTVLSSHLFFNRAEIVTALLLDKDLMKQLFDELKDPNISSVRQRDLTNFLKEFCSFAHSLQPNGPQSRDQFFKTLMSNDVLSTIDPCISSSLSLTREATVELLTMIIDFEPKAVRDFFIVQFHTVPASRNDDLLVNKLIKHMLSDRDPEQTAASQMSNALRVLLDPENIVVKGEKTEFLPLFYKRVMHSLCKPILDNAKDGALIKDDYYTANQLALVIDLLCFFVDHHNYSMRTYMTQKNLLGSVLVYLKSRHHFLALCTLRMCRRILNLNDAIYFKYMLDKGVIKQIVDCFVANGSRYNLLNSALIEFFEFIRTEEIRPLMEYVVENHWDAFAGVGYVSTFKKIKESYDRFNSMRGSAPRQSSNGGQSTPTSQAFIASSENEGDTTTTPLGNNGMPAGIAGAQWRKERECDNDELFFSKDDNDLWYKDDEKEEGDIVNNISKNIDNENMPQRKSGVEPLFLSVSRKRKANDDDGVASIFGGSSSISNAPQSRSSKIVICMNLNGSSSGNNSRMAAEKESSNFITAHLQSPSPCVSTEASANGDDGVSDGASGLTTTIGQRDSTNDADDAEPTSDGNCDSVVSSTLSFSTTSDVNVPAADSAHGGEKENSPRFISSFTSNSADDSLAKDATDKASTNPIILKKGLFGLVDYDESDEDSE